MFLPEKYQCREFNMNFSEIDKYEYRSNDLYKVLMSIGFSETRNGVIQKLHRLSKKGRFTPPKVSNRKVFTRDQIISIAKELGPGGSGEWHFDKLR